MALWHNVAVSLCERLVGRQGNVRLLAHRDEQVLLELLASKAEVAVFNSSSHLFALQDGIFPSPILFLMFVVAAC